MQIKPYRHVCQILSLSKLFQTTSGSIILFIRNPHIFYLFFMPKFGLFFTKGFFQINKTVKKNDEPD
jgi:hypothetical protein